MKRFLFALGLGVAAAAAGQVQAEPVTINFWHSMSGQSETLMNQLADGFNASQDRYKVVPQFSGPYEDVVVKLQAAVPAGRQPDLMMLEVTRYGLFAARNVLEPLDPYLAKEGKPFTDSYFPFALEAAKYLGKSYVLPFNVSTPVLFYNKDAFAAAGLDPEKPPKTWDELLADAKKLTLREGNDVKQWGISAPAQFTRWAFVKQAGGEWVDENNAVMMDSPATIRAYGWLADLVNAAKVGSAEASIKEEVAKQYFLNGQVAMNFGSTGDFGDLRKAVKFRLGIAALPCDVKCAAPIGGATIGIAAASPADRKQGAWEFLKYLSQPKQNAAVFVATGYLPILKGTADEPSAKAALTNEPGYSVAVNQLPVAFARARPPAMAAIRAKENGVWESIVLGQASAEAALKSFAVDMRKLIADN